MRATRLLDLCLWDGKKRWGRVTHVGWHEGGVALGVTRGSLRREVVWVSVRGGRIAPPALLARTERLGSAQPMLGRRAVGVDREGLGRVADLVVDLQRGTITWVILSDGLWTDLVRGRRAVPWQDVFLPPSREVSGGELPPLRLQSHGAGGD